MPYPTFGPRWLLALNPPPLKPPKPWIQLATFLHTLRSIPPNVPNHRHWNPFIVFPSFPSLLIPYPFCSTNSQWLNFPLPLLHPSNVMTSLKPIPHTISDYLWQNYPE